MMLRCCTCRDSSIIQLVEGNKNHWHISLQRPGKASSIPRDPDFYSFFRMIGRKYGQRKLYEDIDTIYRELQEDNFPQIAMLIQQLADKYDEDTYQVEVWFSVLCASLLASSRNISDFTLMKRIKRWSIYQILIGEKPLLYIQNLNQAYRSKELLDAISAKGF